MEIKEKAHQRCKAENINILTDPHTLYGANQLGEIERTMKEESFLISRPMRSLARRTQLEKEPKIGLRGFLK